MNRTHHRTTRPLWEDVAGWILAVGIAVGLVLAITQWWTT